MAGSYFSDVAVQLALLVALTVSLNLLLGLAGQMSMATAAFYGIGAYTCAILTATGTTLTGAELIGPGWPYWAGALSALLVSAVGGLFVALPAARRLKGEYLMLFTLAFHFLFENIAISWVDVTGGPFGIPVPPIAFLSWQIDSTDRAVPFFLIWVLILAGLAVWIGRTPFGRLLRGIREDEVAVELVGKPVVGPKTVVFAFSAALAGGTGALAVGYLGFIAPPTFNMNSCCPGRRVRRSGWAWQHLWRRCRRGRDWASSTDPRERGRSVSGHRNTNSICGIRMRPSTRYHVPSSRTVPRARHEALGRERSWTTQGKSTRCAAGRGRSRELAECAGAFESW